MSEQESKPTTEAKQNEETNYNRSFILKKPFFTTSFSEGNSLNTLEIIVITYNIKQNKQSYKIVKIENLKVF